MFVTCLRPARDPQHAHGAYFPVRCPRPAARALMLIAYVYTIYPGTRRATAKAQTLSDIPNRV